MKNRKINNIGSFQIKSGKVRISDPCYDDTVCAGTLKNVKNGTWNAYIHVFDEGKWGKRVGFLEAFRAHFNETDGDWNTEKIDVGVDSGQAGIFDEQYFKDDEIVKDCKRYVPNNSICEDEPWYSICCDRTLRKEMAGVIPFGAVSSSGYGDGVYVCRTMKYDGEYYRDSD